jgi:hypothetical protein
MGGIVDRRRGGEPDPENDKRAKHNGEQCRRGGDK